MNYAGSSQCSFEAEELTSNKDKLYIGREQVTNNERKRLTNRQKGKYKDNLTIKQVKHTIQYKVRWTDRKEIYNNRQLLKKTTLHLKSAKMKDVQTL